jgi:hypothetical protein
MSALRQLPSMRLKNLQTNNIFELTDREQIGKCLRQSFNSQVFCSRWIDGKMEENYLIRPMPRFKILSCDVELEDLVPREEATISIRKKLTGEEVIKTETLEDLKKFCFEKGIHHNPNIGYSKLKEKVDKWKEDEGSLSASSSKVTKSE